MDPQIRDSSRGPTGTNAAPRPRRHAIFFFWDFVGESSFCRAADHEVAEENRSLSPAGAHHLGSRGAPPKAQRCKLMFWICRRPERHRRDFRYAPPGAVPASNPNMPKGLGGQSGELPVHTLRHNHALMLPWHPAVGSAYGSGIPGVCPYYGPSKIESEEVRNVSDDVPVQYA